MTYESNWKGKRARVRYFWTTYIQVCREHPRFAASEVSVAQVFSFDFRRCSGALRRSFFQQTSARPFSGLPTTTTEDAQTWLAGCAPQVFEKIRHLVSSKMRFASLPDTHKSRWGDELSAEKMKECVWLRPEAVAQIEFLEVDGERPAEAFEVWLG